MRECEPGGGQKRSKHSTLLSGPFPCLGTAPAGWDQPYRPGAPSPRGSGLFPCSSAGVTAVSPLPEQGVRRSGAGRERSRSGAGSGQGAGLEAGLEAAARDRPAPCPSGCCTFPGGGTHPSAGRRSRPGRGSRTGSPSCPCSASSRPAERRGERRRGARAAPAGRGCPRPPPPPAPPLSAAQRGSAKGPAVPGAQLASPRLGTAAGARSRPGPRRRRGWARPPPPSRPSPPLPGNGQPGPAAAGKLRHGRGAESGALPGRGGERGAPDRAEVRAPAARESPGHQAPRKDGEGDRDGEGAGQERCRPPQPPAGERWCPEPCVSVPIPGCAVRPPGREAPALPGPAGLLHLRPGREAG